MKSPIKNKKTSREYTNLLGQARRPSYPLCSKKSLIVGQLNKIGDHTLTEQKAPVGKKRISSYPLNSRQTQSAKLSRCVADKTITEQKTPVGQASRLSEHFWKRRLPHFQLSAGYYFITFSTYNRQQLQPTQKDCIFNAIRFLDNKKYELFAVAIMDDHVHMIIDPMDSLSKIMHSIKSFTAHEINKLSNRKGKVWQDENYDRVIRDNEDFLEKLEYIANNPIKINLETRYEDYKWLYIKGWIEGDI